uniref:Glutamate-rich protein 2 n=1 Tax=Myripristis murdjan TaxID=586833 RepID=A0A668AKJ6_9TELE
MKDPRTQRLSHSAVTGGKTHGPPPVEPIPPPEPHGEEEQTEEEEDADDEGHGAPLQLMAEFLRAVMDGDFQLASKLCQMILIYEPENPEARQFLPLIQEKLLEGESTSHF